MAKTSIKEHGTMKFEEASEILTDILLVLKKKTKIMVRAIFSSCVIPIVKQPLNGALIKKYAKVMKQIYRRV